MATEKKSGGESSNSDVRQNDMSAARAARGRTKGRTDHLSSNAKYALKTIQGARSGLKKAQDNLILGMDIPAELIQACAQVNSAIGVMLFD